MKCFFFRYRDSIVVFIGRYLVVVIFVEVYFVFYRLLRRYVFRSFGKVVLFFKLGFGGLVVFFYVGSDFVNYYLYFDLLLVSGLVGLLFIGSYFGFLRFFIVGVAGRRFFR